MIGIVNISKHPKPKGWHVYEVRINLDVICTFKHKREEDLAICLRRAAEAVEKAGKIKA